MSAHAPLTIPFMNRDPYEKQQEQPGAEDAIREAKRLIAFVMETEDGRHAIEEILNLTGMFTSSFGTNALVMAYAEGRRSVGMSLMNLIDPLDYQRLLKESYERRIKQQRR